MELFNQGKNHDTILSFIVVFY